LDGNALTRDRKPRFLALVVIGLVLLRWWLCTTSGYAPDLHAYKVWSLRAGLVGIHTIYDQGFTLYDYPPLYAYLLAPIGRFYGTIAPEAVREFATSFKFGDSPTFSLLVKLPPLLFDILMALLIARLTWRFGLWRGRSWRGWLPALAYLCLPPALVDSGYWGQPDVIHTFWIMLGLTLILSGRIEWGWVCAGLACLMKPLAVPFLPLLAFATLVRAGWVRTIRGGLAGLAALVAGFLPFILTGRTHAAFQRVFLDVNAMPFTSVNGHNIWWLLRAWYPADHPLLGPITYTLAGQMLFGIAYLFILWNLWRIETTRARAAGLGPAGARFPIGRGPVPLAQEHHWYLAAALVAYSFFTLSTHMHENHAFAVFPFMILLAGLSRRWALHMLAISVSIGVNMLAHDLALGERVWSHVGGMSGYYHPDIFRNLSRFELGMMHGNAVATIGLYALLMIALRRFIPSAAAPPSSAH
jgi:hypothetical protein